MELTPEQREELERIRASRGIQVPPMQIDNGIGAIPEGDQIAQAPVNPALPQNPIVPTPMVTEPVIPESPVVAPEAVDTQAPTVTETAPEATEDPLKGLAGSFDKQIDAVQASADLSQQQTEEIQPLVEQKTKIEEDFNKTYQDIVTKAAKETEEANKKIDQMVEDSQNEKYEGYWQNKSTGEKILGAISMALGAYAQGLSGGKVPNMAAKIINDAMDRDFKEYQFRSNKKIQLINQSRASVAAKQAATREELLRQEAYKVGQLGQIQSKLSEISNKYKGKEVGNKADLLAAQIEQNKNTMLLAAKEKQEAAAAQQAKLRVEQMKEETTLYVPGMGLARTKEEAAKLREEKSTAEEALAAGDRIEKIVGSGITKLNRERLGVLQTELGLIQGAMRLSLIGPGAVTDSEREFMKDLIGDPSKVIGLESNELKKLNTIMNKIRVGLEKKQKNVIVPNTLKTNDTPMFGAKQQKTKTKMVGGVKYEKVDGGWRAVK